jgi:hypothetical protein
VVVEVPLTQTQQEHQQEQGDLVVEDHGQIMEVQEILLLLTPHKVIQVQMETQLLVKNQVVEVVEPQ